MVRKTLCLAVIFFTLNTPWLYSQNTSPIVIGTVLEKESNEPVEMASVSLLKAQDSSLISGTVTDKEGKFSIKPERGSYLLQIQFVSHKTLTLPNINIGQTTDTINIGKAYLPQDSKELAGVEITGERSYMTMESGKKVFNIGRDLSASGANAIDVLENIPAVSVDIEGNINLRGSQGVRILVNGKPSGMMGLTGSEALEYFPANQIKRVEIITNPSAKYEAQGSAGIINIILAENRKQGVNGSLNAELGHPKDHGVSLNTNYRKKWFNIFGNYNFNVDRSPGGGWSEQTFTYPDTTYSLYTDTDRDRGGTNHSFQFGSDFYLGPNDLLRLSGVYSFSDEDNYTDLTFKDYYGASFSKEDLARVSVRDEHEKEDEEDYEFNLSYEKNFGAEDHNLTADMQARSSIETEDARLTETAGMSLSNQDTSLFQHSLNDTDVKAYLAKIDYSLPLGEEGLFEAGFRGEIRDITNNYFVRQRESAEEPWNQLDEFSNTFSYEEAIYGLYAQFENKSGSFSYQGGMRIEYTGISTRLASEGYENQRDYYDFFPSLSVTYSITELNSLQLSYSRRLDRPYFRRLNPYGTFNNNRNYRTGNPALDPEYTGAYDFGYIRNKEDNSFYIGAFYRRTVNDVEGVDTVNNEGVTVSKPYNLASRKNAGIEARYNSDILDWWDITISSYFYRGQTIGEAAGEDLNATTYTMSARASMDFDIKNWFELQLSGDYRAPEKEGQDEEKAMYEIDMGIRKKILDDKGNLALSIRDIFNTDAYESQTQGNNFYGKRYFRWRTGPVFSLTFSYTLDDKASKGNNF